MTDSTARAQDAAGDEAHSARQGSSAIRLAVVDGDSGFLQVLTKRLDGVGWQYRVLASPVPLDTVVAMRLNAIVIDLAALGPQAWGYLERLCSMLPGLGADDWVTKPCHPEELIARVEAVVRRRRRAETRQDAAPLVVGEVEIRPDQYQAFVGGTSLDLTRREFELIRLLAEAAGQVLQREEIYQRVWGYAMAHGDRSVDVFVRKLRQKLERSSPGWRYIHTHFGIGYRFAPESVDGVADREAVTAAPEPALGDEAGAADTELVS